MLCGTYRALLLSVGEIFMHNEAAKKRVASGAGTYDHNSEVQQWHWHLEEFQFASLSRAILLVRSCPAQTQVCSVKMM